ncbi:uncharacterized protein LOC125491532 [Beta vulgaris subsp. vulgaris]|uniref:uncharacterized protein LOC125491532 n=1 Tax=Beta vulgaris subsp. vulgaris TaxID=3555 RepID=UPI002547FAE6|nr:uncharacterized protein LOC125491532 [Beta vulgaris subsp. vulgaris]
MNTKTSSLVAGNTQCRHSVLPKAEHRHCARHIFALWHKNYKGEEFKFMFWKAVWAYNEVDYQDALEEMGKVSPSAVEAFKGYDPRCFCRAFTNTVTKCDVVVSNMAETFNGYILGARTKHLIFMLEDIRTSLMQRLIAKREELEKYKGSICPRIQAKLEKEKDWAASCNVMPSSKMVFQVSHRLDTLTVDLTRRVCTCRKWELTGIPCCHAVACIFFLHQEAESYVHEWYKKETHLLSYSSAIPPCVGERHWPRVELLIDPPPIKVGPGRPRKNRRKDPHEDPKKPGKLTKHGTQMTCSLCQSTQHNKRRCPEKGKEVQPQPKKGRGRPRKVGNGSMDGTQAMSFDHHNLSAQPTLTGKGGRVLYRGRGSRGASTSRVHP